MVSIIGRPVALAVAASGVRGQRSVDPVSLTLYPAGTILASN